MPLQFSLPAQFQSMRHQDCNYRGLSLGENGQNKVPESGQQHSHWKIPEEAVWFEIHIQSNNLSNNNNKKITLFDSLPHIIIHPTFLVPSKDLSSCSPNLKRGENNRTQMNTTKNSWAEESSGNTALGVKCGTPESPCGGSILKHRAVLAPQP